MIGGLPLQLLLMLVGGIAGWILLSAHAGSFCLAGIASDATALRTLGLRQPRGLF
jgi:hypothetical protein